MLKTSCTVPPVRDNMLKLVIQKHTIQLPARGCGGVQAAQHLQQRPCTSMKLQERANRGRDGRVQSSADLSSL